ncbi:hypothetical protein M758_12G061300, partial [Ceratodon purpureus]
IWIRTQRRESFIVQSPCACCWPRGSQNSRTPPRMPPRSLRLAPPSLAQESRGFDFPLALVCNVISATQPPNQSGLHCWLGHCP